MRSHYSPDLYVLGPLALDRSRLACPKTAVRKERRDQPIAICAMFQ